MRGGVIPGKRKSRKLRLSTPRFRQCGVSSRLRLVRSNVNAGGRTRTDMGLLPPDFESGAYTDFATPARNLDDKTIRAARQPGGGDLERLKNLLPNLVLVC
jgi:hypothetical protein